MRLPVKGGENLLLHRLGREAVIPAGILIRIRVPDGISSRREDNETL